MKRKILPFSRFALWGGGIGSLLTLLWMEIGKGNRKEWLYTHGIGWSYILFGLLALSGSLLIIGLIAAWCRRVPTKRIWLSLLVGTIITALWAAVLFFSFCILVVGGNIINSGHLM